MSPTGLLGPSLVWFVLRTWSDKFQQKLCARCVHPLRDRLVARVEEHHAEGERGAGAGDVDVDRVALTHLRRCSALWSTLAIYESTPTAECGKKLRFIDLIASPHIVCVQ